MYLLIFIDYFLISHHKILALSNIKKNEWRAITHFLQKNGLSPTEAAKKLNLHYGDSAPDRSTVSRSMSRFTSGRQSLEDVPRSGAPTTAKTHTNIDLVKGILDGERERGRERERYCIGLFRIKNATKTRKQ